MAAEREQARSEGPDRAAAARHEARSPDGHALLALQRAAGNVAVAGLVQRAAVGEREKKPLDSHSELHKGIRAVGNDLLDKYPSLSVTSTTGGGHAKGSYHYRGMAVDIGGAQSTMDEAAGWIDETMKPRLLEGIHNPGLSVKDTRGVGSSFWGKTVWSEHRNHIHLASDEEHGLKGSIPEGKPTKPNPNPKQHGEGPAYRGKNRPQLVRHLHKGMSGVDVVNVQMALRSLGYHPGSYSGEFDDKTDAAVRKFQRDRKLGRTGIVGHHTGRQLGFRVRHMPKLGSKLPTKGETEGPSQGGEPSETGTWHEGSWREALGKQGAGGVWYPKWNVHLDDGQTRDVVVFALSHVHHGKHKNRENIAKMMARAQQESTWNTAIVNKWDSNWAAHIPSIGLFQVIGPTFETHKKPGMDNIWNPYHNAVAALRYMIATYGHVVGSTGSGY